MRGSLRSGTPPSSHSASSSSFYRNVRENFSGGARAPTPAGATFTFRPPPQPPAPSMGHPLRDQTPHRSPSLRDPLAAPPPPQPPAEDEERFTSLDIDAMSRVEYAGGLTLSGTVGGPVAGGTPSTLPRIAGDVSVNLTMRGIVVCDRPSGQPLLEVPLGELCQLTEDVGLSSLLLEVRNGNGTALLEIGTTDSRKLASLYKALCVRKNTWEREKADRGSQGGSHAPQTPSLSGVNAFAYAAPISSVGLPLRYGAEHYSSPTKGLTGWAPPLVVNGKAITPDK